MISFSLSLTLGDAHFIQCILKKLKYSPGYDTAAAFADRAFYTQGDMAAALVKFGLSVVTVFPVILLKSNHGWRLAEW